MSKSTVIAILFDGGSENIFYTGQFVSGHVHVQTSERIKIRGIRLELTGKAETSWSEGSGDDTTSYSGKENYIDLEICLVGSRSDDSELYLEPALYKYPFSFILHPELPQSFEDITGHIRYRAKAVIDRPMRIDDKAEILFTVIHLLDLNRESPHLREPQVIQSERPPTGCCCIDGFAEIKATINRGCFVPGETISIDGEIANRSNTNIKFSTITLFQNIQYCATLGGGKVYHSTNSLKIISKCDRPFIRRGLTDSWSICFVVPQVLSSRLDGCGIINIKHYIEISATFHDCCSKSAVCSEIVIGNIPLRIDPQPSVVTSQPVGFPTPNDLSIGYMPPMGATNFGFDTSMVQTWNRDVAEVHESKTF